MRKKKSAITVYLSKRHRAMCSHWVFSGDRHCSCGLEAALKEYKELLAELERLRNLEKSSLFSKNTKSINVKGLWT